MLAVCRNWRKYCSASLIMKQRCIRIDRMLFNPGQVSESLSSPKIQITSTHILKDSVMMTSEGNSSTLYVIHHGRLENAINRIGGSSPVSIMIAMTAKPGLVTYLDLLNIVRTQTDACNTLMLSCYRCSDTLLVAGLLNDRDTQPILLA